MHIDRLVAYVLLLFLIGCGVGGGAGPSSGGGGTQPTGSIYVDSVKGDDSNSGDISSSPVRTITHAITISANKTKPLSIVLVTGTYDAASGEVFPIKVPSGVTINSYIDLANNQFALVLGTGSYTSTTLGITKLVTIVLSGNDSKIHSIVVEGPGGLGIWNDDGKASIENCVIQGSDTGVVSAGSSLLQISRTTIQNNVSVGLDALNNASPTLKQSNITGNGIGMLVSGSATPSFHDQANELLANTDCDLRNLGSADLAAQGVLWDNDQFLFTVGNSCSGGANIVNEGSGSVSFQTIPIAGVPVFVDASNRITLNTPIRGSLISTNSPDFSWIPNGSALTLAVVWDRPPSFFNGGLGDMSTIQWLWHSGLGTGVPGAVTFNDGRTIPNGDINNLAAPQPLQRGKTYYWAVWEWDKSGLSIQSSSELGYFTILN